MTDIASTSAPTTARLRTRKCGETTSLSCSSDRTPLRELLAGHSQIESSPRQTVARTPLDHYLPCRLRAAETDERIKALSYQLHDMLVHYLCSRFILIDPILAINTERPFRVRYRRRLETNSVVVEVESAAGRRLCVFRDGLRERVARLFKRIFAGDGLRVPVKELA